MRKTCTTLSLFLFAAALCAAPSSAPPAAGSPVAEMGAYLSKAQDAADSNHLAEAIRSYVPCSPSPRRAPRPTPRPRLTRPRPQLARIGTRLSLEPASEWLDAKGTQMAGRREEPRQGQRPLARRVPLRELRDGQVARRRRSDLSSNSQELAAPSSSFVTTDAYGKANTTVAKLDEPGKDAVIRAYPRLQVPGKMLRVPGRIQGLRLPAARQRHQGPRPRELRVGLERQSRHRRLGGRRSSSRRASRSFPSTPSSRPTTSAGPTAATPRPSRSLGIDAASPYAAFVLVDVARAAPDGAQREEVQYLHGGGHPEFQAGALGRQHRLLVAHRRHQGPGRHEGGRHRRRVQARRRRIGPGAAEEAGRAQGRAWQRSRPRARWPRSSGSASPSTPPGGPDLSPADEPGASHLAEALPLDLEDGALGLARARSESLRRRARSWKSSPCARSASRELGEAEAEEADLRSSRPRPFEQGERVLEGFSEETGNRKAS